MNMKRVRNIEADTPSRFNADRRLYGASGCAVRLLFSLVC